MKLGLLKVCIAVSIAMSAVLLGTAVSGASQTQHIKKGGSITVILINGLWETLDPAHNGHSLTGETYMNSIYGGLFYEEPGAKLGLGMASGYSFSNHNQTLTITIRPGIKFSDGTPYDASAVALNISRDLAAGCDCAIDWRFFKSATAVSKYKVVVQYSAPNPLGLEAFVNEQPDWALSPAQIATASASTLGTDPVGAGPYEVSDFVADSKIVLTKNPHYYIPGEPYLDQITFLTNPVDQSAVSALESGSAQVAVGVTTGSLIDSAASVLREVRFYSGNTNSIELNSYDPPFNNIVAREAVAYAINEPQLLSIVSAPGLGTTVEEEQGPVPPYYEKTVPGYIGYNLSKAQQLVQQLGGLSFTLFVGTSTASGTEGAAIQAQLEAAGIKASLVPESLPTEEVQLADGQWAAEESGNGGPDPDLGSGSLPWRMLSSGPYTCCHDATLDGLINKTTQYGAPALRIKAFDAVYAYVAKNVLVVPLYTLKTVALATKNIQGFTAAPAADSTVISFQTLWLK